MVIQGLIRPPPEIRAVADRTALFVAKNGRGFESRILNSSKGQTPKFAFLHDTSPFHAYYEDRIRHYEEHGTEEEATTPATGAAAAKEEKAGGAANKAAVESSTTTDDATAVHQDPDPQTTTTAGKKQSLKASAIDPIAQALLRQRHKIAEYRKAAAAGAEKVDDHQPPQPNSDGGDAVVTKTTTARLPAPARLLHLELVAPKSLSIEHLEVIQLTAQFVALSSSSGGHEQQPPVHFLDHITRAEWTNPYFGFCQPRHALFPYFSALVDSYKRIKDSWEESSALSESTTTTPPPPLTLNAALELVAYRAEYERDQATQQEDPAAKIDWHCFVVVETIDFGVDEEVVALAPPPPPPPPVVVPLSPPPSSTTPKAGFAPQAENMMDEVLTTEDGETIRVVPSYTPKVADARSLRPNQETMIDPITGKTVRVQDVPEHMRIQLLDPKWAEERKKFQDKQRESNLVSGDVVAANLERFSQQREDRFGKKEQSTLLRHDTNETRTATTDQSSSSHQHHQQQQHRDDEQRRAMMLGHHPMAPVGPALPGQQPSSKHPLSSGMASLPPLKRPRVGFAGMPAPMGGMPPPPQRPTIEDPFAVAATGAMQLTNNDNESGGGGGAATDLIDEAAFAASVGTADVLVQVRIPNDPSQLEWNYYGQVIPLTIPIMATIKVIKNELSTGHLNQLPVSKMQLKNVKTGAFLKDSATLAALNIGPGSMLEMVPRARGGKKK